MLILSIYFESPSNILINLSFIVRLRRAATEHMLQIDQSQISHLLLPRPLFWQPLLQTVRASHPWQQKGDQNIQKRCLPLLFSFFAVQIYFVLLLEFVPFNVLNQVVLNSIGCFMTLDFGRIFLKDIIQVLEVGNFFPSPTISSVGRHLPKLTAFIFLHYDILAIHKQSAERRLVPPQNFLLVEVVFAESNKNHRFDQLRSELLPLLLFKHPPVSFPIKAQEILFPYLWERAVVVQEVDKGVEKDPLHSEYFVQLDHLLSFIPEKWLK